MSRVTGINKKACVILPDTHFPVHDPVALEVALRAIEVIKPARVIHLGDLLDCEVFSAHGRRSVDEVRAESYLRKEIEPAREMITRILKSSNYFHLIMGNHENRVERLCANMGPLGEQLYEMIAPELTLLAGFPKGKVGYTPYSDSKCPTQFYKVAKDLIAVHGWSYAKQAARAHLDAARSKSVIYGHSHRQDSTSTRDPFTNKVLKAMNFGTLSKLQPTYLHGGKPSEWTHGFGLIYHGLDKRDWTDYSIAIRNGKCVLPDGTEVRGK